MNTHKLIFAWALLLGLLVTALPCLASDATPSPTPTAELSAEDAALVAKVNGLYYDYSRMGLHQFKCEVKLSVLKDYLEKLKASSDKDPKYLALKDVRFLLSYDEKTGMKFAITHYQPTGEAKNDKELKAFLDGTKQLVGMFWDNWYGPTFDPIIDSSSVTVKKNAKGYEITEAQGSHLCTNIMNQDLLVREVDIKNPKGQGDGTTLEPKFIQTDDGWLMNDLTVTVPNKLLETFTISYQEVSKYQLPSICYFGFDSKGVMRRSLFTLEFSNYQLN
jgi:hypothetical protein